MSQHPCAHGLSWVPMAVPPIPRSAAAPHQELGPGSRPVPSPGVPWGKEEQGEREVLTRAARDIAGLGLQLGALAGFPSAPRGHAPPRPGPGPSPAGHRAQAPWGPLLPRAVNCNTAQRRCRTLPAPRGSSLLLAPRGPGHCRPPMPRGRDTMAELGTVPGSPPCPAGIACPTIMPKPKPQGPRAGSGATATPYLAPASLLGSQHRQCMSPHTHAQPGSPQPMSTHRARSPLARVAPTGAQLTREGSRNLHGTQAS